MLRLLAWLTPDQRLDSEVALELLGIGILAWFLVEIVRSAIAWENEEREERQGK